MNSLESFMLCVTIPVLLVTIAFQLWEIVDKLSAVSTHKEQP
jgi:hypothetical protein